MVAEPATPADGLRRRLQALEQVRSARVDSAAWLASVGLAPERVASPDARARLEQTLLVVAPSAPAREGALGLDALRAVLLDPAYQLK